jgi:hypothetical protein
MKISHCGAWMYKLIKQWTISLVERFVNNAEGIFQVRKRTRTNDWRGDAWLIFSP